MNRLPGLDLIRAIAIVWVMLFHSFLVGGLGPDFGWLSRYGWMGVDMFFVLSGFLIGAQVLTPLQQGKRLSFAGFYRQRAYRILPAFAVVLALYASFPSLREAPGLPPWWQFATFTMNLLADYPRNQAFSHAWSLCVEEHFYLVFPLLAWRLARRPSARRLAALCAGVVALGIVLRTTVWLHDTAVNPLGNWFIEDLYYPTWMRLDGLLVGVLLAVLKVYRAELWARLQARANLALLGGLALLCLAFWLFRDRVGLLGNAIGWPVLSFGLGLLVFAAAGRNSLIGRWRLLGASWVATISYSLYLSHKIGFHLVQVHFGAWLQGRGLLAFTAYAAGALLAGVTLHYLVERPFLRLRDRRAIMGSGPPASAPAAGGVLDHPA